LTFSHYDYNLSDFTSEFWGVETPGALFFIENSDDKGILKIKPKKDVVNLTQEIQIVGSNSSFRMIKVLVKKETAHFVFPIERDGVLIDGDVGKFISKAELFGSSFFFRNVGLLSCPSMYYAEIALGEPDQVVSNAYVDYDGETNTLVTFTQGNAEKIKVKYGINDSHILAGADGIRDVYTKDFSAIYTASPPSGKIAMIKTKIIAGTGEKEHAFWEPAVQIIASERPKLKLKPEQIVTEGTSVYITP